MLIADECQQSFTVLISTSFLHDIPITVEPLRPYLYGTADSEENRYIFFFPLGSVKRSASTCKKFKTTYVA